MPELSAIRTVLAAYRSTAAEITEEQIEAAWAEYEEVVALQRAGLLPSPPDDLGEALADARERNDTEEAR